MNKKNDARHLAGRKVYYAGRLPNKNLEMTKEALPSGRRTARDWLLGLSASWRNADSGQKRAGRNLVLFLVLMLAMTIIARGTSAATLPRVETDSVYSAEVTETVRGTATVKTGDKSTIQLPEGLPIQSVLTSTGSKVNAGDPLLQLDMDTIQTLLAKEKVALENLQLKKSTLDQSQEYDDSSLVSAQRALERANADYITAKQNADDTVAKAQSAYDTARKALNDAKQALTDLKNKPVLTPSPEPSAVSEHSDSSAINPTAAPDPTSPDSTSDPLLAAQQLVDEKTALLTDAQNGLDAAKKQREADIKMAQRTIDDAKLALDSAQKSDKNGQTTHKNQQDQNALDAKDTQLEIDKQKKKVDRLAALVSEGGLIKSETTGIVMELSAAGQTTAADQNVAAISNEEGAYEAEMLLPKADASKIEIGAKVDLVSESNVMGSSSYSTGTIASKSEADESGMVTLKIRLPDQNWKQGASMQAQVIQRSGQYDNCLPISALHADGKDYYVFTLQHKSTILGQESVLVKVPVTVLSRGGGVAAISASFMPGEKIVTGSDKPIAEGDRVRMKDDG